MFVSSFEVLKVHAIYSVFKNTFWMWRPDSRSYARFGITIKARRVDAIVLLINAKGSFFFVFRFEHLLESELQQIGFGVLYVESLFLKEEEKVSRTMSL